MQKQTPSPMRSLRKTKLNKLSKKILSKPMSLIKKPPKLRLWKIEVKIKKIFLNRNVDSKLALSQTYVLPR